MVLEIVQEVTRSGETRQVATSHEVRLTKINQDNFQLESESGIGLFNIETGHGRFMTNNKNLKMIFSKGVQVQLTPEYMEVFRKEIQKFRR